MVKPPRELLDLLFRYDPPVQSLALGLRQVVVEEMAPCHEYIFAMRSKVVLIYGSTGKVITDAVCMVNVFAKHVILVFRQGTDLHDPTGALRGTGKTMRHLRLKALAELDRPEIRTYLREARRIGGFKRRGREPREVITRVKTKPAVTMATLHIDGRINREAASARWPSTLNRDR